MDLVLAYLYTPAEKWVRFTDKASYTRAEPDDFVERTIGWVVGGTAILCDYVLHVSV